MTERGQQRPHRQRRVRAAAAAARAAAQADLVQIASATAVAEEAAVEGEVMLALEAAALSVAAVVAEAEATAASLASAVLTAVAAAEEAVTAASLLKAALAIEALVKAVSALESLHHFGCCAAGSLQSPSVIWRMEVGWAPCQQARQPQGGQSAVECSSPLLLWLLVLVVMRMRASTPPHVPSRGSPHHDDGDHLHQQDAPRSRLMAPIPAIPYTTEIHHHHPPHLPALLRSMMIPIVVMTLLTSSRPLS